MPNLSGYWVKNEVHHDNAASTYQGYLCLISTEQYSVGWCGSAYYFLSYSGEGLSMDRPIYWSANNHNFLINFVAELIKSHAQPSAAAAACEGP